MSENPLRYRDRCALFNQVESSSVTYVHELFDSDSASKSVAMIMKC